MAYWSLWNILCGPYAGVHMKSARTRARVTNQDENIPKGGRTFPKDGTHWGSQPGIKRDCLNLRYCANTTFEKCDVNDTHIIRI